MFTRFYALLRAFMSVKQFNVFTRFYALLRAFTQFSKLSSLQFTPFTVYSIQSYTVFKFYPLSQSFERYRLFRSGLHNQHPLKLVATAPFTPSTIANHFFGKDSVDIFEKMKSYLKAQLFNASSSSTVSQKQKRVFVFNFFCVTLLREALVYFYALLSQLSSSGLHSF